MYFVIPIRFPTHSSKICIAKLQKKKWFVIMTSKIWSSKLSMSTSTDVAQLSDVGKHAQKVCEFFYEKLLTSSSMRNANVHALL